MKDHKIVPFAQKCPKLGVTVSGNIHYNLHTDTATPGMEKWLKTGFECNRQRDCDVAPRNCPIFDSSPEILKPLLF